MKMSSSSRSTTNAKNTKLFSAGKTARNDFAYILLKSIDIIWLQLVYNKNKLQMFTKIQNHFLEDLLLS